MRALDVNDTLRVARDLATALQRIEGAKHFTPEDHPRVLRAT